MNTTLANKLQTQKHGQIESLIDDIDTSTKGSDMKSNPRQMQKKMKSTNSLPESQASTKIFETKNALNELKKMLSELPNMNKNGYQGCTQKWNTTGAINVDDLIVSG